MPHRVHLNFYQGSTFDQNWTWKVGLTEETALPVDLTGCTAKAQVKSKIEGEVLLEMTTENSRIILGGSNGNIRILIADDITSAFTWDAGVWDLFIYFQDGTSICRMQGNVTVQKKVTT